MLWNLSKYDPSSNGLKYSFTEEDTVMYALLILALAKVFDVDTVNEGSIL